MLDRVHIKKVLTENESWCGSLLKKENFHYTITEVLIKNKEENTSLCGVCLNMIIHKLRSI